MSRNEGIKAVERVDIPLNGYPTPHYHVWVYCAENGGALHKTPDAHNIKVTAWRHAQRAGGGVVLPCDGQPFVAALPPDAVDFRIPRYDQKWVCGDRVVLGHPVCRDSKLRLGPSPEQQGLEGS